MVELLSRAHMGVKGLVVDSNGWGVARAIVTVEGIDKNITSSGRGEYWRLLVPGYNYTLVQIICFYILSYHCFQCRQLQLQVLPLPSLSQCLWPSLS